MGCLPQARRVLLLRNKTLFKVVLLSAVSICLLTSVSLKVMLLIDIELAYMNTNHEDFIGFAK